VTADNGQAPVETGALAQTSAPRGEAAAALPMTAAEEPSPSHSKPPHAVPVRVANLATDDADEAATSGSFAVQLAAPATESEARRALTQFAHKYGSILGTRHLKFHRAKVGGKSVFRVRVGGLTKNAATNLCKTLQGRGGSCFVARD
jgi:PAB1-binding protein PBP1